MISDKLVQKVEQVRNDYRVILADLRKMFPDISRSFLGEIVLKTFDYRKSCARRLPGIDNDKFYTWTPSPQKNKS